MRIFLDSNAPEFFNDISESIRAFYPQADISIEQPGADFVLRLLLCPTNCWNLCDFKSFYENFRLTFPLHLAILILVKAS